MGKSIAWIALCVFGLCAIAGADTRFMNPLAVEVTGVRNALRTSFAGQSIVAPKGSKLIEVGLTLTNRATYEVPLNRSMIRMELANGSRHVGQVLFGNVDQLNSRESVKALGVIIAPTDLTAGVLRIVMGADDPLEMDLTGRLDAAKGIEFTADGLSVKDEVEVRPRNTAPLGMYDVSLQSLSYAARSPYYRLMPAPDESVVVATVQIRNWATTPVLVSGQTLAPVLIDGDGRELVWSGFVLQQGRDEPVAQELGPGQRTTLRFLFKLPKNVLVSAVRLRDPMSGFRSVLVKL